MKAKELLRLLGSIFRDRTKLPRKQGILVFVYWLKSAGRFAELFGYRKTHSQHQPDHTDINTNRNPLR